MLIGPTFDSYEPGYALLEGLVKLRELVVSSKELLLLDYKL
jgi:hypothetical protein